jgi:signal transduction histidine kinase
VPLEQTIAEVSAGRTNVAVRIDATATVVGEPDALARSLENLVENAVVHGPAGGRIDIHMTVEDGVANVAVTDEGPGFSAGEEEVAFERFWRSEDASGRAGSGIGLAIVKASVERHGGSVRASGSTVTITLPTVDRAS